MFILLCNIHNKMGCYCIEKIKVTYFIYALQGSAGVFMRAFCFINY
jgi:hypothetical protein